MAKTAATQRRQGRAPERDPRPTGIDPNGGSYRYKQPRRLLEVNDLTLKKIRGIAAIQATRKEGAAALGVALRTLEGFLAEEPDAKEAWQMGRQAGRASLRRTLFEQALVDPAQMRFLAKHYLGMDDKQTVAATINTSSTAINVDEARTRAAELMQKLGIKIRFKSGGDREMKDVTPVRGK